MFLHFFWYNFKNNALLDDLYDAVVDNAVFDDSVVDEAVVDDAVVDDSEVDNAVVFDSCFTFINALK